MAETRQYIDAIPTKEQCAIIKRLITKEQIAQAAVNNRTFPDVTDQVVITSYFKAAMDNYAEAQHDKNEWWKEVIAQYELPPKVSFDFDLNRFYVNVEGPNEKDSSSV